MKELVKPERVEKEYGDAQTYCEGWNSRTPSYCSTRVDCGSISISGGDVDCPNITSAEDNSCELLF